MSSRLYRLLAHALITLGVLGVALFLYSLIDGAEIAVGNLVLRSQRGVYHPLDTPPKELLASSPEKTDEEAIDFEARNVVLFIGDGMGIGHLSAAAALIEGPGGDLAMSNTRFVGLVRTWAANTLVTDSAASATAFATGHKTDKRMVGVLPDGSAVKNLFEAALERGMTTGVITTSGLVDATAACFTAHVDHRDSYDEILEQMLDSGTQIMIGGDWLGRRKVRRNQRYRELVDDLERLGSERGYEVVRTPEALESAGRKVLAVLPHRAGLSQQHGPPLAVSTRRVVSRLIEEGSRFFLVVESELTDSLAHKNDITRLMEGMRELDEAVATVVDLVGPRDDTLVVVTADHDTGSLAVTDGYYEDARATVRWATSKHSTQWVPLFAFGPGAEAFAEVLDNTEVAARMAEVLGLDLFPKMADNTEN